MEGVDGPPKIPCGVDSQEFDYFSTLHLSGLYSVKEQVFVSTPLNQIMYLLRLKLSKVKILIVFDIVCFRYT